MQRLIGKTMTISYRRPTAFVADRDGTITANYLDYRLWLGAVAAQVSTSSKDLDGAVQQ